MISCYDSKDTPQEREVIINYTDIDSKRHLIDGFNIIIAVFPNDTIRLNPIDDGYLLYSYMETEPFPIDVLYTKDAENFIWWVAQYPLDITDSHVENPNEYYRSLLLEKIYE